MIQKNNFSIPCIIAILYVYHASGQFPISNSNRKHLNPTLKACCKQQNIYSISSKQCDTYQDFDSSRDDTQPNWPETNTPPIRYETDFHCSGENSKHIEMKRFEFGIGRIYEDGFLQINKTNVISPQKYCMNSLQEVIACQPSCSRKTPCVRKCCLWRQHFVQTEDMSKCGGNSSHLTFSEIVSISSDSYWKNLDNFLSSTFVTTLMPNCNPATSTYTFRILKDGNIEIEREIGSWMVLTDYCIERQLLQNGKEKRLVALYCNDEAYEKTIFYYKLQMWCSFCSWVSLALTIIVYLVLWQKHSTHGWCQFSFITAVFLYYLTRFFRRINEINYKFSDSIPAAEMFDYFFNMAFLTNLLNLSIDMFWAFAKLTPLRMLVDKRKIFISCGMCWGFALLITLVTAGIRQSEPGIRTLWIVNKGMQSTILITNFLFSVSAGIIIWFRNRDIEITKSKGFETMTHIFIKIFLVSGIIWTLKVFELWIKMATFERSWFWDIVQVATYTYGVVLSIVLLLNRRMLGALKERFPQCAKLVSRSNNQSCPSNETNIALDDGENKVSRSSYNTQSSNY